MAEGRIRGYGKMAITCIVEIERELVGVKEQVGYKDLCDRQSSNQARDLTGYARNFAGEVNDIR